MKCPDCNDTGVIDTGNNDFPCKCPLGDRTMFNVAGRGPVSGRVLKQEEEQLKNQPLPDYLK